MFMSHIIPNYYDIVILPPKEVANASIELSQRIAVCVPAKLVLGYRAFKPHISLYHVAISKKNLPQVFKELKNIVSNFSLGKLTVGQAEVGMGNSVVLPVIKTPALQQLHELVLERINPLRDKSFPSTWKNPGWFEQKVYADNIKNYGTPVAGNIYSPHITVSMFGANVELSKNVLKSKVYNFMPSKITVCALGPHHSCHRVIRGVEFGKAISEQ